MHLVVGLWRIDISEGSATPWRCWGGPCVTGCTAQQGEELVYTPRRRLVAGHCHLDPCLTRHASPHVHSAHLQTMSRCIGASTAQRSTHRRKGWTTNFRRPPGPLRRRSTPMRARGGKLVSGESGATAFEERFDEIFRLAWERCVLHDEAPRKDASDSGGRSCERRGQKQEQR